MPAQNCTCNNNSFLDKYKTSNSWNKYNQKSNCTCQSNNNNSSGYNSYSSGSGQYTAYDGNALDILNKAGPHTVYQPNGYVTDTTKVTTEITHHPAKYQSVHYAINEDPNPVRIVKPTEAVCQRQNIRVRYLEPPELPTPAPIIIKERQLTPPPPAPPIIIRQHLRAPPTPPPLVIREKPPCPPEMPQTTIIEKVIPPPTPPPRQVIVERIPAPEKPREIIYEKWMPYKPLPERQVIVERAKTFEKQPAPKNVIIEYERPNVCIDKQVFDEGVIRADPRNYNVYSSCGREEIRVVDNITDMPVPTTRSQYGQARMCANNVHLCSCPSNGGSGCTCGGNVQYQSAPRPVTASYAKEEKPKISASGSNVLAKGPASYAGPWNTTYRSSYTGKGFRA